MKEISVLNETENPLFGRKEISIVVDAPSAPAKPEVFEFLAKKFSVPKENVKIKKISGKFGTDTFTIDANIYKSKEAKYATELYSKKEKDMEAKVFTPPVEEKKEVVEEKVEEKPAEDVKEEAK